MSTQLEDNGVGTENVLQKRLAESGPGRDALAKLIEPLIKQTFGEALDVLEFALPHTAGDGSQNAALFQKLRGRLLRFGNDRVRELPTILGDFAVEQVFVRQTTKVNVGPRTGPFGLPPNVKMPEKRQ